MKLSTRGRYGVRLMLELALQDGTGPVYMKALAERQGISDKYLWQLLAPLKRAGLVRATRGANGGYRLARPPAEISLREILRILEGPLCLVDCVETPAVCERAATCVSRDVWREVAGEMNRTLAATTLATMVARERERTHGEDRA